MKFITIKPQGRLGNLLIEYMVAMTLTRGIEGAVICGLGFEEWGIPEIAPPPDGLVETLQVTAPRDFDVDGILAWAKGKSSFNIVLASHLQQYDAFLDVALYRETFPVLHADVPIFDERYLLINIRTGDILNAALTGFYWYPLMPIGFYRDLVNATGKLPVFLGELDDCLYVRQLKAEFPDAMFIPSQGVMRDFDTIRSARHICVAISTFSWVAAWLSGAERIYLPLNGFYNPAHQRDIDLVPSDDPRYEFYLFPLNYAMDEAASLGHHTKMQPHWRRVSRSKVKLLRFAAPRIQPFGPAEIDAHWYVHNYLDAAMDISEGWYADAGAHYLDFGRAAGYLPYPPVTRANRPRFPNIALGKAATQSSVSAWSVHDTVERDAAGAVDGDIEKPLAFHTNRERHPWWVVDLGGGYAIYAVHIHNRKSDPAVRVRASPLILAYSVDGVNWVQILKTAPGHLFGAESGPLCWESDQAVVGRYVSVSIDSESQYLHLAQVEIFGEEA